MDAVNCVFTVQVVFMVDGGGLKNASSKTATAMQF